MKENKEISPIIESPKTYWFLIIFTATLAAFRTYFMLTTFLPSEIREFDFRFDQITFVLHAFTCGKLLRKKFDFLITIYILAIFFDLIFTGIAIVGLIQGRVTLLGWEPVIRAIIFGGNTLINFVILICLIKIVPKETFPTIVSVEGSDNCDATCPNCESLIKMHDEKCETCQASFGELSAWRPKPL